MGSWNFLYSCCLLLPLGQRGLAQLGKKKPERLSGQVVPSRCPRMLTAILRETTSVVNYSEKGRVKQR